MLANLETSPTTDWFVAWANKEAPRMLGFPFPILSLSRLRSSGCPRNCFILLLYVPLWPSILFFCQPYLEVCGSCGDGKRRRTICSGPRFWSVTPSEFLDTQAYTFLERLCAFGGVVALCERPLLEIACSNWPELDRGVDRMDGMVFWFCLVLGMGLNLNLGFARRGFTRSGIRFLYHTFSLIQSFSSSSFPCP
jgi:hypothetical protein